MLYNDNLNKKKGHDAGVDSIASLTIGGVVAIGVKRGFGIIAIQTGTEVPAEIENIVFGLVLTGFAYIVSRTRTRRANRKKMGLSFLEYRRWRKNLKT